MEIVKINNKIISGTAHKILNDMGTLYRAVKIKRITKAINISINATAIPI